MKDLIKLYQLYKLKEAGEEFVDDMVKSEVYIPKKLKELREVCKNCTLCDLHKTRKNVVCGEGNVNSRLMFVGEAPGQMEDISARPFVGRAGKLLREIVFKEFNKDLSNFFVSNVVKCRPPFNRVPTIEEAQTCKPYLLKEIEIVNPDVIVCLGKTATLYLLGENDSMSRLRGKVFELDKRKVVPTYHPSFLLRNPTMKPYFVNDLKKVKRLLWEK